MAAVSQISFQRYWKHEGFLNKPPLLSITESVVVVAFCHPPAAPEEGSVASRGSRSSEGRDPSWLYRLLFVYSASWPAFDLVLNVWQN